MKILDIALVGVAAVAASDLAGGFLPDSLDFGSLPVRKYGGGAAGAFAASHFFGHKLHPVEALIAGAGAVFASDMAQNYLPASLDLSSLPLRKYAGAVAAVWASTEFGLLKKHGG